MLLSFNNSTMQNFEEHKSNVSELFSQHEHEETFRREEFDGGKLKNGSDFRSKLAQMFN